MDPKWIAIVRNFVRSANFHSRLQWYHSENQKGKIALLDVRLMAAADVDDTASLFQEMQAHYGVPCPPFVKIVTKLSKLPEGVNLLVAADPNIVGFAALGAIFPGPGLNAGLVLKELFVSACARGRGVGTRLMHAAAQIAVSRGFIRLDFTADRSDIGLLRFYADLGAVEQSGKAFFRLTGNSLMDLATNKGHRSIE